MSCYINSMLQCMTFCTTFLRYFSLDQVKKHYEANYMKGCKPGSSFCPLSGFVEHLQMYRFLSDTGTYAFFQPNTFLGEGFRSERRWQGMGDGTEPTQEDAQEYLIYLLPGITNPWYPGSNKCQSLESEKRFGGATIVSRKCLRRCGAPEKRQNEHFTTVVLNFRPRDLSPKGTPVASLKRVSLSDLLVHYSEEQILPLAEAVDCQFCKSKQQHTEKRDFTKYPPVLVLQLARFRADGSKIENPVDFEETLGMPGLTYNLRSVSAHLPGHYISYVKSDTNWFLTNDRYVREFAPGEELLDQKDIRNQAYVLFYEPDPFDYYRYLKNVLRDEVTIVHFLNVLITLLN